MIFLTLNHVGVVSVGRGLVVVVSTRQIQPIVNQGNHGKSDLN